MRPKSVSSALLAAILLCLLVLLVRDFQRGRDSRYRITTLGFAKPQLIRVDVRSGDAWRLDESEGGGRHWARLADLAPRVPTADPGSSGRGAGKQASRAANPQPRVLPEPTAEDIQLYIDTLIGDDLPGEVRAWTAQQLSGIDSPRVTDALLQGLNDPDPEVVGACATALAKRHDPRVRAAFEALREHPKPAGRPAAQGTHVETLD
jgi:HEAT repeats